MKNKISNELILVFLLVKLLGTFRIIRLFFLMLFASLFDVLGVAGMGSSFGLIINSQTIEVPTKLRTFIGLFKANSESLNTNEILYATLIFLTLTMIFYVSVEYLRYKEINRMRALLSSRLFSIYLKKPYREIVELNTDDLSKNILLESDRISSSYLGGIITLSSSIILAILTFILFSYTTSGDINLALLYIGTIYIIIYLSISKNVSIWGKKVTEYAGKRFRSASESLKQQKIIKISNYEKRVIMDFKNIVLNQAKYLTYSYTARNTPRYIIQWLIFVSIICWYLVTYQSLDLKESISSISIIGLASYKLLPAIQKSYASVLGIIESRSAFELIKKEIIEENKHYKVDSSKNNFYKIKDINESQIEIKNCTVSLNKEKKSLIKNISFIIKPGSNIALFGPSGCGKSTTLNMILGLLPPDKGEITIGGKNIYKDIHPKDWNNYIGYVPQNVYLFDDTIVKNIILFSDKPDKNYLNKIIKITLLNKVLEDRNCTINEKVGDNGIKFSGGQIQRIGLARALYKKPKLLILDEATNALDKKTELTIIKNIIKEFPETSILAVTHRSETLKMFDETIYMEYGEIQSK